MDRQGTDGRRLLSLRGVLRVGRGGDIWRKVALSVVTALAVPDFTLLALGRLDLVLYTSGGAMCALYAHGRPYAARSRTLLWVVLGMLGSMAVALLTSASTESVVIRVAVAALLAAAHKVVCDAVRIGPPGNLVFTFIAASCAFVPQRLGDVPAHVGLGLLGGCVAWLVCMAPALVRPDGPERVAVARALDAAARLLRAAPGQTARARHDAAAAANAAWHTLALVPARKPGRGSARKPGRGATRATLERFVARAESALAAGPGHAEEADRLTRWARDLRRGRTPVMPAPSPAEAGELVGLAVERAQGSRRLLRALRPGSPVIPIGARVAVGAALAGWCSAALGVGRPYWAVVTAAAVFQANLSLTWQRAVQRVLGNLVGLLVFTAVLPLTRTAQVALVVTALAFQFGAEALIGRNYWLGTVCVTPMALLVVEFAGARPAGRLIADRWLDTCVGAVVGLLGCFLIADRRAGHRIDELLDRVVLADATARALLGTAWGMDPRDLATARDRLVASLVELREAVDAVNGEWWRHPLPEERIASAEREGHRTLARTALRLSTPVATALAS
ncbi:FUSC family protein [Actinoallomurus rhizosphaericola]|uniref:FUSC family protein n=1 Tax=Actinoallomurus rhizosphaericola TaxID=2952536 RepID=UPI00209280FF|nr:FUSC family protein [Actinoallomurus rhizosphaericola]MCO5998180.1 FUSC family protein [Actinoallomurus rhizosphaericola]